MTLGLRQRESQLLTDLRQLPGLVAWYDFARTPLGSLNAPQPNLKAIDNAVIDRAWDMTGNLGLVVNQTVVASRPLFRAPRTNMLTDNVARCGEVTSSAVDFVGLSGAVPSYDTTLKRNGAGSIKVTMPSGSVANPGAYAFVDATKLKPNTVYTTGHWVYIPTASGLDLVAPVTIAGTNGATNFGGGASTGAKDQWAWIYRQFTTSATGTGNIRVGGYRSGTADRTGQYFNTDDWTVTEGAISTPPVPGPGYIPGGLQFDGVDDRLLMNLPAIPDLTAYCIWTGLDGGGLFGAPWEYTDYGVAGAIGMSRSNGTTGMQARVDYKIAGNDTQATFPGSWNAAPHLTVLKTSLTTLLKSGYTDEVMTRTEVPVVTSAGSGTGSNQFTAGRGAIGGLMSANNQFAAGVMHELAFFRGYHDKATRRQVSKLLTDICGMTLPSTVPA